MAITAVKARPRRARGSHDSPRESSHVGGFRFGVWISKTHFIFICCVVLRGSGHSILNGAQTQMRHIIDALFTLASPVRLGGGPTVCRETQIGACPEFDQRQSRASRSMSVSRPQRRQSESTPTIQRTTKVLPAPSGRLPRLFRARRDKDKGPDGPQHFRQTRFSTTS